MANTLKTTGKTPYEIRLELLQLAQDHLRTTYERQMSFANESLRLATDAGWKTIEELKKLAPVPYTVEDVISKAQQLYGFVQKKD